MSNKIAEHAVVIGAGMGGLAAAKAAAPYFDRVTVLERDGLPEDASPRPGTPQARHLHVLLAGGLEALETLMGDVGQDLEEEGAVKTRVGLDIVFERPGFDPFPQRDLGFDTFCMSRPLLESICRRRVASDAAVTFRPRARAVEIVPSSDRTAVAGVRYDDSSSVSQTIPANLIVDASGRAAPTLAFLETVGFEKPDEDEIGIDQAYSTAMFDVPDDASTKWRALIHLPDAPRTSRGGFYVPIEGHRWIVSLGGNHGDAPPGDIDGFMAFAKSFRTPTVYHAIRNARSIGDIARFNLPRTVRRRFERLGRFPRDLVPIADSVCRFKPIFGQGMSVAAQEAVALGRLLGARAGHTDPLEDFAKSFFSEIQGSLEAPWATSLIDFVYPKTRGERPADLEKRLQYGAGLNLIAAEDPAVHRLLAEVTHLLKPQSALRRPEIAKRVAELMEARA
jgi:2-polyprenyl-6-methoxyphenol hydroxylase-like FAD-dependent oxidoreductase